MLASRVRIAARVCCVLLGGWLFSGAGGAPLAEGKPISALVEAGGVVMRLAPAAESGKLVVERVKDGDRAIVTLPAEAGRVTALLAAPWIDCGLVAVARVETADGKGHAYYWLTCFATEDRVGQAPMQEVFANPAIGRIPVPEERYDLFGVRATTGDSIGVVLGRHTRSRADDYRFEGWVWINNCPVASNVPGVLHRLESPTPKEESKEPEGKK